MLISDKRMWCFECGAWVKPEYKMGGEICPRCRSKVYTSPEGTHDKSENPNANTQGERDGGRPV